MVRPVRIRIAGSLLAVSRQNCSNRRPVSGLRSADPGADTRRSDPAGRAGGNHGICVGTVSQMVRRYSLCLSHHESLPVGRARSQLVRI